ncbi:hypothetical protein DPX16_8476 [Anabarilius grahami]|uniref:Uncharacterized protein n=1 Tax=Anabarilius grahami TaxID=495550 RepID=A0A3N0Z3T8_ANAGA|nr:hypothetical protein DPX16_8476 [Anabarilius grahami]
MLHIIHMYGINDAHALSVSRRPHASRASVDAPGQCVRSGCASVFFSCSVMVKELLISQSVSNALFSSCLYEAPPSEMIGRLEQCVVIGQALPLNNNKAGESHAAKVRIVSNGVQPYIVQTGVDTDGETQEEVTTIRMKLDVSECSSGLPSNEHKLLPPAGMERHFISRRRKTDVLFGRRLSNVGLVCQGNFGPRRCRRQPTPQSAFVATSSSTSAWCVPAFNLLCKSSIELTLVCEAVRRKMTA